MPVTSATANIKTSTTELPDKVVCHALAFCTFGLCALPYITARDHPVSKNLKQVASGPIPETATCLFKFP